MSSAMRDKPQQVTLCDLCGEEITESTTTFQRSSIVATYGGPSREASKVNSWGLWWDPRSWPGLRRPFPQEAASPRWRPRQYDMHTECLIRDIEHAIALRESGRT